MKLVTVIVPIYNVADYLPRCLDSIVGQTYTDLEILLVDDGSTDASGCICDEYASRDSRIRVIHKPNGGPSVARNVALDMMTGELLMMVDSDDWLQADAIERLCQIMAHTGADIVAGGWRKVYSDTVPDIYRPTPERRCKHFTSEQALSHIFYQKGQLMGKRGYLTHSPWGKLYSSRLFKKIRFPVGLIYEDLAVAFDLYGQCNHVVFTESQFYNYLQRPTSFMGGFSSCRTQVIGILEDLEHRIEAEQPDFLPAVQSRLLSASFNVLLLCPQSPEYAEVTERCWSHIRRLRLRCFFDRQVRIKNKLGVLASLVGRKNLVRLFGQSR